MIFSLFSWSGVCRGIMSNRSRTRIVSHKSNHFFWVYCNMLIIFNKISHIAPAIQHPLNGWPGAASVLFLWVKGRDACELSRLWVFFALNRWSSRAKSVSLHIIYNNGGYNIDEIKSGSNIINSMKIVKSILFVVVLVMTVSCSPKRYYSSFTYLIDYQKYTEEGFFLTESNSVSFEYSPVGSVCSVVESRAGSEAAFKPVKHYVDDTLYENDPSIKVHREIKSATVDDAIATAIECARVKGANGIINLSVTETSKDIGYGLTEKVIIVKGMAIKR